MKKTWKIFIAAAMAVAMCACDNDASECLNKEENDVSVTLTFAPYDMAPMTRSSASIAGIVTHLDVWIIDGDDITDLHQASSDDDFGELTVILDKTRTYTLYAVAHRCADDATLADGIITFPDDKVTHSMFFTTTFSPSVTTSLSCLMQRIVAQFRIETTDAVPADMKKIQITINDVFDRWSVTTGGTHNVDRTYTINITSTAQDGTVALNVFAIVTDAQTLHAVTVTGLDANDGEILSPRTFADVPLRNGYRTTYRGALRDATTTSTFTVEDWNEYPVVDF